MADSLDAVMKRNKIGDAELGASCSPRVHRTLIWCYRKRKKTPRADTANALIAALAARGVAITLDEILTRPARRRSAA